MENDTNIDDLAATVAPCGLVCGLCKNATPEKGSCPGCWHGGGDEKCEQRSCCATHKLDGCWQCAEFPCNKGHFSESDAAWSGVSLGSVECVKRYGLPTYLKRLMSRVGNVLEYGEYRFRTPEEIVEAYCGTEGTQQRAGADGEDAAAQP